jgi:5-methyltetrahydropteroyltriglutamate--homocysteine methyltransferase
VQRLLLEYDDARSGTFEPLKDVAEEKFVILGLISTKSERLESLAQLRQRVAEASGFFPFERLGLSPQCGFASSLLGNPISPEVQQRKLELVATVAHELWG